MARRLSLRRPFLPRLEDQGKEVVREGVARYTMDGRYYSPLLSWRFLFRMRQSSGERVRAAATAARKLPGTFVQIEKVPFRKVPRIVRVLEARVSRVRRIGGRGEPPFELSSPNLSPLSYFSGSRDCKTSYVKPRSLPRITDEVLRWLKELVAGNVSRLSLRR